MNEAISESRDAIKKAVWAFTVVTFIASGGFFWFGIRTHSVTSFVQAGGALILGGANIFALILVLRQHQSTYRIRKYTKLLVMLAWGVGTAMLSILLFVS